MASAVECAQCSHGNAPGGRFCIKCGADLRPQAHCSACNHLQPVGDRFCANCGGDLDGSGWDSQPASGAVVDGVWERGPEEFIRRVDPLDARTFLGSRVVRVPPGSVGVVLVEGVVDRVLAPGRRTTLNLFERVANFFTSNDRTAFYLVDLRPIPVPFTIQTRPTAQGRVVQTQVLVSFSLQRGNKDGISHFVANVVRGREAYAAADLYALVRPEVTRMSGLILERLAGQGEFSYAAAEAEIRDKLTAELGPRYGLGIDVTVAPLTTTASLNFHLGTGQAPQVRPCTHCAAELPSHLLFCDQCGMRLPTLMSPARVCSQCAANVASGDAFCAACGHPFEGLPVTASPLFTADGEQIEADLVVRVRGQHEDFAPERIAPALTGAAAAHVRTLALASVATSAGFGALEQAMARDVASALTSYGMALVSVNVLDVRSKTGQWLLAARADLNRATEATAMGRKWLEQRSDDLDLMELTLAQRVAQQKVERVSALAELTQALEADRSEDGARAADKLARAMEALQDRRARQLLATGDADLDVADARRQAQRDLAVDGAQRAVSEDRRKHAQGLENEAAQRRRDQDRASSAHHADLARQQLALDAERARQATTLANEGKQADQDRQLDKLRAMATMDRDIAAQEHEQALAKREQLEGLSESQMIAMQAAELAKAEDGGAAWAEALSQRGQAQQAQLHAAETKDLMSGQLDRMERLADRALQGASADKEVYSSSMEAMGQVAASKASPAQVVGAVAVPAEVSKACTACGTGLKVGAKFCGACGTSQ